MLKVLCGDKERKTANFKLCIKNNEIEKMKYSSFTFVCYIKLCSKSCNSLWIYMQLPYVFSPGGSIGMRTIRGSCVVIFTGYLFCG